jgi:hypothetical protein
VSGLCIAMCITEAGDTRNWARGMQMRLAKQNDNFIHTSNFHLFINGMTCFAADINRNQGHINLNEFVAVRDVQSPAQCRNLLQLTFRTHCTAARTPIPAIPIRTYGGLAQLPAKRSLKFKISPPTIF